MSIVTAIDSDGPSSSESTTAPSRGGGSRRRHLGMGGDVATVDEIEAVGVGGNATTDDDIDEPEWHWRDGDGTNPSA